MATNLFTESNWIRSDSGNTFHFDISGDAIGAPENVQNQVDYLNSDRVELSNGVVHHSDGMITIPAGVQSFTVP